MLALTRFGPPRQERPLLVLGPSLGTSARTLWGACASGLAEQFDLLAWDLPGHGDSVAALGPFTVSDLAAGVVAAVDMVLDEQGRSNKRFGHAGDSIGGAVSLALLLDHADRVPAATALCTAARIGEPTAWHDRARQVRAEGTTSLLEATPGRWFGPGFTERAPRVSRGLLDALVAADDESYALTCEALATFDVRERLEEIAGPLLAVAGSADIPTPVSGLRLLADTVADGRLAVLEGVAHLAPAEAPDEVARLVADHHRDEFEEEQ